MKDKTKELGLYPKKCGFQVGHKSYSVKGMNVGKSLKLESVIQNVKAEDNIAVENVLPKQKLCTDFLLMKDSYTN